MFSTCGEKPGPISVSFGTLSETLFLSFSSVFLQSLQALLCAGEWLRDTGRLGLVLPFAEVRGPPNDLLNVQLGFYMDSGFCSCWSIVQLNCVSFFVSFSTLSQPLGGILLVYLPTAELLLQQFISRLGLMEYFSGFHVL